MCNGRCASVIASTSKDQKDGDSRSKRRNRPQQHRRQDIGDTFGLLADHNIEQVYNIHQFKQNDRRRRALAKDDDEDDDDEIEDSSGRPETVGFLVRKHDPEWYGRECDRLAKEGKVGFCDPYSA